MPANTRQFSREFTMMSAVAANIATFTAATNDVITSAGHGLSDGDVVTVANSGGALPAGLSASTYYFVISSDTNTFKVSTTSGGSAVDITDAGTGTHTWYQEVAGLAMDVTDYEFVIVTVNTASSADVTLKFLGGISNTSPTWLNAQSVTDRYEFLAITDHQTGSNVAGDTGLALSGTDDHRSFEINVNGQKWLNLKTLDFVAGALTIKLKAFN